MLPEAPVPAKRKQAGLVVGAVTSCGIAVGVPPTARLTRP